jgi:hypothetical protein
MGAGRIRLLERGGHAGRRSFGDWFFAVGPDGAIGRTPLGRSLYGYAYAHTRGSGDEREADADELFSQTLEALAAAQARPGCLVPLTDPTVPQPESQDSLEAWKDAQADYRAVSGWSFRVLHRLLLLYWEGRKRWQSLGPTSLAVLAADEADDSELAEFDVMIEDLGDVEAAYIPILREIAVAFEDASLFDDLREAPSCRRFLGLLIDAIEGGDARGLSRELPKSRTTLLERFGRLRITRRFIFAAPSEVIGACYDDLGRTGDRRMAADEFGRAFHHAFWRAFARCYLARLLREPALQEAWLGLVGMDADQEAPDERLAVLVHRLVDHVTRMEADASKGRVRPNPRCITGREATLFAGMPPAEILGLARYVCWLAELRRRGATAEALPPTRFWRPPYRGWHGQEDPWGAEEDL